MSARKMFAGLGATALVASALALTVVAPANADPISTPGATDLVGVGSDTTQFVMDSLADGATVNGTAVAGFNAGKTTGRIATFAACTVVGTTLYPCTPGGNVTLRTGASPIARPNGSGAGKGLLYGATNDPNVTFARSSSGQSTAEDNAGLFSYPFARDTLVMVTSSHTASHAPASLTPTDILNIYTGVDTNWSQIDSTKSGVIKPEIPQTGSGTRTFFLAQLQAINGGTAPTLAGSVTEVQEHDPTTIQDDPNAVSPFSLGRANLAGTVRVESGWKADRAVYNVVRGTNTDNPDWAVGTDTIEAAFGNSGFICSAAARPLIEAAGFKQLKSIGDGGSCGTPTQGSDNNLAVYDDLSTPSTTTVAFSPAATAYGHARTASVTVAGAGGTPSGTVTVSSSAGTAHGTLSAGHASVVIPATLRAGTDAITVSYSGDSTFGSSSATKSLVVAKTGSADSETFAATVKKGKRAKGNVRVVLAPASTLKATGAVSIKKGARVIARGTVRNGVVTITLPKLAKGKNNLVISYAGNANVKASTKKFVITQK
ncbi:MAG: Phosphate transporter periplasmic component-like protein [Marmoricola sp.]|nr:Phosphate transporter periplasmic component-like protein [Marmoricola sp.]